MEQDRTRPWWSSAAGSITLTICVGLLINHMSKENVATGPLEFIRRSLAAVFSSEVWINMGLTLLRFLSGFLIALVVASVLGIAMGRSRRIEGYFLPIVSALKPIPSAAMIPFAMFLFAYGGITIKLFVIIFGVFWPILLQVIQGAKDIDTVLLDTGRTLGKSQWTILRQIVIPATFPSIMVGARVGIGIGLLLAVTTEMLILGSPSGVGYLILDYERSYKHPEMVGAVIALGLVGWLLDVLFLRVEKLCLPWHHGRQN